MRGRGTRQQNSGLAPTAPPNLCTGGGWRGRIAVSLCAARGAARCRFNRGGMRPWHGEFAAVAQWISGQRRTDSRAANLSCRNAAADQYGLAQQRFWFLRATVGRRWIGRRGLGDPRRDGSGRTTRPRGSLQRDGGRRRPGTARCRCGPVDLGAVGCCGLRARLTGAQHVAADGRRRRRCHDLAARSARQVPDHCAIGGRHRRAADRSAPAMRYYRHPRKCRIPGDDMMRRFAMLLLAGCTAVASPAVAPSSCAEIDADAGSAGGIAQCSAQYSAGLDPSGLWSRLNSTTPPKIKITTTHVPDDGTGTKTHEDDDGIQIFWDPSQNVTKDGITAGPCEVLYHELQHAADDADDIPRSVLDDSCSANGTGNGKGIPYAEWRAVAAENAYRKSLGLTPLRMSYNKTPFGFDKYSSFDDCKKQNQPPPAKKPTNSVFGDPHLATTDGLLYDLQQVGEFTAFTSGDTASPRVQIRTAPVGDSKTASLVSAAAAGNANQRIAFISKNSVLTISHTDGTNTETVTIDDGAQRDLGAGMTLTAAASTDFTGRGYTVHWAEGSQLQVNDAGWWGLLVSFEPSGAAKAAQPRGLLGNFNGDPADDLIRPDGRRVATEA